MTEYHRKLALIHGLAFVLLFATWLAGISIAPHAGTPLVALYYVLHIFPASVIFVLILLQWQISSQKPPKDNPDANSYGQWNGFVHQLYDAILAALPITGILIFYEPKALVATPGLATGWLTQMLHDRFFHHIHAWLFNLLLALVVINAVLLLAVGRKRPDQT